MSYFSYLFAESFVGRYYDLDLGIINKGNPSIEVSPKKGQALVNFSFNVTFESHDSILCFFEEDRPTFKQSILFSCKCKTFSEEKGCKHYPMALYHFHKNTQRHPEINELEKNFKKKTPHFLNFDFLKTMPMPALKRQLDWKTALPIEAFRGGVISEEKKKTLKPPFIFVVEFEDAFYDSERLVLKLYHLKKETVSPTNLYELKPAGFRFKDLELLRDFEDKEFFRSYLIKSLQGTKSEVTEEITGRIDSVENNHPMFSETLQMASKNKRLYLNQTLLDNKLVPLAFIPYEKNNFFRLLLKSNTDASQNQKSFTLKIEDYQQDEDILAQNIYIRPPYATIIPEKDAHFLALLTQTSKEIILSESELNHFMDFYTSEKITTKIKIENIKTVGSEIDPKLEFIINMEKFSVSLIPHFRYGEGEKEFFLKEETLAQKFLSSPPLLLERQFEKEDQIIQDLEGSLGEAPWEMALDPTRAYEIISKISEHKIPLTLEGKKVHTPKKTNFFVTSGIDWIDLKGNLDFGELGLIDIVKMKSLLSKGRSIPLGKNDLGLVPELIFNKYKHLFELGEIGDSKTNSLHLNKLHAFLIDDQALIDLNISSDEAFKNYKLSADEILKSKTSEFRFKQREAILGLFKGELRDYQKKGVNWLLKLHSYSYGGILADDMGLGKTIQVIFLFSKLKEANMTKGPHLIVVPKSLVFNWKNEFEKFLPSFRVLPLTNAENINNFVASPEKTDVALITYHYLRNNISKLETITFDYAILDEAQTIKNETAQITKTVFEIKSIFRLALTGTPVENSLLDLASIFEFVFPKSMTLSLKKKLTNVRGETEEQIAERKTFIKRFAHFTAPFILRRKKEEVLLDLPLKVENSLFLEFSPEEEKFYQETKRTYQIILSQEDGETSVAPRPLKIIEAILRLRQACLHPSLIKNEFQEIKSSKIERLLEMLKDLRSENSKAIVFSQFTSFLELIKKACEEEKITYSYLDGSTSNREEAVAKFHQLDCTVFLCSLKAGGVGLNLTAADYVFIMDPWWNPAAEAQAIDRAHRIGQKKTVFAYRFIMKNSIEEKVTQLQKHKRELASTVLDYNEEGFFQALNKDEMRELFN